MGGKLQRHRGEHSNRGAEEKVERFVQRIGTNQHSTAREVCLLTHRGRWGLGAEARASKVRSQGEDWGWLQEHSLKGATAPQLAGRESKKSLDLPKRQETIVSGYTRRGDSEHRLNELQRRA